MKKLFLFLIVMLCLPAVPARAITVGFATSKSLFDAEILPGTTYQDELVIFNNSAEAPLPLHLQLSVWDLVDGSEVELEFDGADEDIDPTHWFTLVTSGGETMGDEAELRPLASGYDFILDPDSQKLLRFRVRPPNETPAGTYLVSMRFQAAIPEHFFENTGPRFVPEMAVLFFLKIPHFSLDGAQGGYAAEILDVGFQGAAEADSGIVKIAKADILDDAAKVMVARVRNTGEFYFKVNGSLQIHSWTGRVVKDTPLPPRYMLPGRVRTLEIPLSSEATSGLLARVGKYFADNAYLGRYTATMILRYPQISGDTEFVAGNFIEESVGFWVFPWRLVLMVGGIAGLLAIFFKRFGRRLVGAFRIIFLFGKKRG